MHSPSQAFDRLLDRAQAGFNLTRRANGNTSLAALEPAKVIGFVNSLEPIIVRGLIQSDRDAMATNLARYLAGPQTPDRAGAQLAYDTLIRAGALPDLPGQNRAPRVQLARAFVARLNQQFSPLNITPNLQRWDLWTLTKWNPSPLHLPATTGPDGRGFATVREAMLGGAGRATQQQNRLTLPFNVEAEHGYLVVKTAQARFINVFVRGNYEHAITAQRLIAAGAPVPEQAEAIESYRLGTAMGALAAKLIGEGRTVAAAVHSHPRLTTSDDPAVNTDEFPSGVDLLSAAENQLSALEEAVVFLDARDRLSMSVYSAKQTGQRLDISIATFQNAERRNDAVN